MPLTSTPGFFAAISCALRQICSFRTTQARFSGLKDSRSTIARNGNTLACATFGVERRLRRGPLRTPPTPFDPSTGERFLGSRSELARHQETELAALLADDGRDRGE